MTKTQAVSAPRTSPWTCPICGRPFTAVDMVLYEHERNYQCRYCWNRVKGGGAEETMFRSNVRRLKLSRS